MRTVRLCALAHRCPSGLLLSVHSSAHLDESQQGRGAAAQEEERAMPLFSAPVPGNYTLDWWQAWSVQGSTGDDTITTGMWSDHIYAGGGVDAVYAGGGNDVIYGERGNDLLFGQGGDDTIFGGDDNDYI